MRHDIEVLEDTFPSRLNVYHTLTGEAVPENWRGGVGRLAPASFEWLFGGQLAAAAGSRKAIVCGPQGLLDFAATVLFMDLCLEQSDVVLLDS